MLLISSKYVHVFDCDGVLLDSNFLKLDALSHALKYVEAPSAFISRALEEFRSNFGRTRLEHFRIFQSYTFEDNFFLTDKKKELALNEYSNQVKKLYKDCKIIKETKKYVQSLKSFYVVSASDQEELRKVLPHIYFDLDISKIYGGPFTKIHNIVLVQSRESEDKEFILYGDSIADAKAALSTKINFIGLTKYSADPIGLKNFCDENFLPYFNTCKEINL